MIRLRKGRTFDECMTKAQTFVEAVEKFNPYHDKRGRFASGGNAASFTYSPGKSRAHDLAIAGAVAKDAVAKAKAAEPQLTKDMQSLASKYGGEMVGLDFAVKSAGSLKRKLVSEQKWIQEEEGRTPSAAECVRNMYDINRYTMKGTEKNLASMADGALKDLRNSGYTIVAVKNTMGNLDAPYRGINCKLMSKDGMKIELQFHTAKSLEIKEINHKLYEKARLDSTSAKTRARLNKQMADNARSIPIPDNIDSVGKFN